MGWFKKKTKHQKHQNRAKIALGKWILRGKKQISGLCWLSVYVFQHICFYEDSREGHSHGRVARRNAKYGRMRLLRCERARRGTKVWLMWVFAACPSVCVYISVSAKMCVWGCNRASMTSSLHLGLGLTLLEISLRHLELTTNGPACLWVCVCEISTRTSPGAADKEPNHGHTHQSYPRPNGAPVCASRDQAWEAHMTMTCVFMMCGWTCMTQVVGTEMFIHSQCRDSASCWGKCWSP